MSRLDRCIEYWTGRVKELEDKLLLVCAESAERYSALRLAAEENEKQRREIAMLRNAEQQKSAQLINALKKMAAMQAERDALREENRECWNSIDMLREQLTELRPERAG